MDVIEEIKYFDSLLEKYSPAEIMVLDRIEGDGRRAIIAILKHLIKIGKVEIKNEGLNIKDFNTYGLSKSEAYVLLNIRQGKVRVKSYDDIYRLTYENCKKMDLIKYKKIGLEKNTTGVLKLILFVILGYFFVGFGALLDFKNSMFRMFFNSTFRFVSMGILLGLIIYYLVAVLSTNNKTMIDRTKAGNEINKRIDTFKEYVSKYKKDFDMWDNYDLYSIMFNIDNYEETEKLAEYITEEKPKELKDKNYNKMNG